MLPRRRAAVVVALATLTPVLLPWPASSSTDAADTGTTSGTDATTVVVQLTAPDQGRLAAVANRPIIDRDARLDRLAALVPDVAQHAAVSADLRARGFTVDDQSTWSVTATAPASVVAATFGTVPSTTPNAGAALPDVPASLTDDVAVALPVDAPVLLHPAATGVLTGADVRNAGVPAGIAASTGGNDAALTIATIQFATWNAADLTTFASSASLPDPVASGQYRAVDVDGGPSSANGTVEVAIDQESLLSVAPTAHQTAYLAPNSGTGFLDSVSQVYDDVTGSARAHSPDPHIGALSISWGACESAWGNLFLSAMNNELAALTAAGVTVFASSGDSGIYDCYSSAQPDYRADVDFPASSPWVVAVGGTTLRAPVSAPNTGSNWTESAWSCTSRPSCPGNATGGGVSGSGGSVTGFAKPSWQQAAVTDNPFAAATTRMVPDIAADGDPRTGMRIYSAGSWGQYGGTSLAAPLAAGQLIDTLGDAGRDNGVGDIHEALYQAYTATRGLAVNDPARVFRDVTTGTNGPVADRGTDPSVRAGVGYDTVSGLGGVLWAALGPFLRVDVPTPAASTTTTPSTISTSTGAPGSGAGISAYARLRLRSGHGAPRAVARWHTVVTGGTLVSASVRITSGAKVLYAGRSGSGRVAIRVLPGQVYVLTVVGHDNAGHPARRTVHLRVRGRRRD